VARILIAEDEEPIRALLARALAGEHQIATACDGAEAFDMLKREGGDFDLLLTDIVMPVMDGIALALAAARDFPALPIMLMTGYAHQHKRAADLEALIRDIIVKPFSVAEIRFAVAAALVKGRR
jgi:CheY-like chemotaxis protein